MPQTRSQSEAGAQGSNGESATRAPPTAVKLVIELGPLLAFLLTLGIAGIMWATGVLMVAAVAALIASWKVFGRVLPIPVATAVLVLLFGGLTLWLDDPRFIKVKPTIVNVLFAALLIGGLILRRPFLKLLLGEAFSLTEEGWRKLTVRWIGFFVAIAVLNEIIWRNFSDAVWGTFKALGILSLTAIFAMAQIGLIRRYEAKSGE